ncbi:MAG: hypothetical protein ABI718_08830 [Acidobacteriota bacterium]
MAFEKWTPQPEFERFPASATIVQSRLIRLPSPVAGMLRLRGKTSAHLFYDRKRKLIGIKPLDRKEEGAAGSAKIRQSEKSTSLHVPSFFRTYQIDVPGIKRFHCWYDEKERMAMIDISRPSPRGRPAGT